VTKAPNWHGLVTLDILFNNLSTGLFLVAALGELVAPASFRSLAGVAYPIALLFLVADLVCLVLDLGDPLRFHHMLRVWKPSSPMSLGTWCLTAYAVPLTCSPMMSLLPGGGAGIEWLRRILLVVGLVPALGSGGVQGGPVQHHRPARVEPCPLAGRLLHQLRAAAGRRRAAPACDRDGATEGAAVLRLASMLLLILNLVALGCSWPAFAARWHRPVAPVGSRSSVRW
jgi:hypothetical protein